MSDFNEQQTNFLNNWSESMTLIGGRGSGKTRTLLHKAVRACDRFNRIAYFSPNVKDAQRDFWNSFDERFYTKIWLSRSVAVSCNTVVHNCEVFFFSTSSNEFLQQDNIERMRGLLPVECLLIDEAGSMKDWSLVNYFRSINAGLLEFMVRCETSFYHPPHFNNFDEFENFYGDDDDLVDDTVARFYR